MTMIKAFLCLVILFVTAVFVTTMFYLYKLVYGEEY